MPPSVRIVQAGAQLAGERRVLDGAMRALLVQRSNELRHAAALLESCSYQKVLLRGFAIINDAQGRLITSSAGLRAGMRVVIRLADGTAPATVDGPRTTGRSPRGGDSGQGTLI